MKAVLIFGIINLIIGVFAKEDNPNNLNNKGFDAKTSRHINRYPWEYYDWDAFPMTIDKEVKEDVQDNIEPINEELEDFFQNCYEYSDGNMIENETEEDISDATDDAQNNKGFDAGYTTKPIIYFEKAASKDDLDKETKEQCYVKALVKFDKCEDKKNSIVTCMLDSLSDFAKCFGKENLDI